ncbi:Shedu anti-phage system protein SduA domain-containing protein, partial [Xanthomonas phaseoli]|uniref:Shedu anti-phage system protein SduA domain-containing protein n=1 Tax=Xanthomonas phaseoli TaxID=1985254 RepID=UPI001E4A9461
SNLGREVGEQVYQAWCEKHCWAFGNAYVIRDEVRNISSGDSLDLLLPNIIAGYRDIVELKRPDKDVLVYDSAHRNYYFSADVSKAIGQCHRYLDILHEQAKHGLLDRKEVVAYHPRATIVIGRSNEWDEEQQRSLHGLNRRLHGISVMTYDHLLAQGERLIEMMSPSASEALVPAAIDDDIPW